jgi:SAM-dependent methyltransferase
MRSGRGVFMIVPMDDDIAQIAPWGRTSAWGHTFAAIYDPFLWVGERVGLRAHRHELLGRARGFTVDIGSGTGLNLPHYPDHLDDLVLAEPDPAMRARLTRRLERSRRRARIVDAPAERLPFADQSVDTVVSTFVLCTVSAPDLALAEIGRVLRPDGQFLFIEHVRSDSPKLARWQDRLDKPWRRFAQGCRCNRATAELIGTRGFELAERWDAPWSAMPPIVRPLIIGSAQLRSSDMAGRGSDAGRAQLVDAKKGKAMTASVHVGLFPPAVELPTLLTASRSPVSAGGRVGS